MTENIHKTLEKHGFKRVEGPFKRKVTYSHPTHGFGYTHQIHVDPKTHAWVHHEESEELDRHGKGVGHEDLDKHLSSFFKQSQHTEEIEQFSEGIHNEFLQAHGYKKTHSGRDFVHHMKEDEDKTHSISVYKDGGWIHHTTDRSSSSLANVKTKSGKDHRELDRYLTNIHGSTQHEEQPKEYTQHLKNGGKPFIPRNTV